MNLFKTDLLNVSLTKVTVAGVMEDKLKDQKSLKYEMHLYC